jgi:hypothetical protein
MGEGLRYTITHIGDIAMDKLANGCNAAARSTRGIVLTYDIHEQGRKKNKIIHQIGERIAELKEISPESDIFNDLKLKGLFDQLNGIETLIKLHLNERDSRLYPGRADQNCEAC